MCINPSAMRCNCDTCQSEKLHVNRFRNKALYRETVNPDATVNPIAAWLNSERWTMVTLSAREEYNLAERGSLFRGMRVNAGGIFKTEIKTSILHSDSISGEIVWR